MLILEAARRILMVLEDEFLKEKPSLLVKSKEFFPRKSLVPMVMERKTRRSKPQQT